MVRVRSANNGGGRDTFEFQGSGRGQRGFYGGNPRGRGGLRGRGNVEAQPTQVGTQEQQTHLNFHQGWAKIPMTHPPH